MRSVRILMLAVATLWLSGCGEEIDKANLLHGKWGYVRGEEISPIGGTVLSFDKGQMSLEAEKAAVPAVGDVYAKAEVPVEISGTDVLALNAKSRLYTGTRGSAAMKEVETKTLNWFVKGIEPGSKIRYAINGNELTLTYPDGKQAVYKRL